MRAKALRFAVAALTAVATAGALAIATVPAAAAVTSPQLYAIENGASPALLAVDPTSGATAPVADLSGLAPNEQFLGLAPDRNAGALYALMEWCYPCGLGGVPNDALVRVAGSSGSVTPLAMRLGGYAVDPATGLIWAITNCYTCTQQSIVSISPATGIETDVLTIPFDTFGPTDYVAVVPRQHQLYLAMGNAGLFSFDTQSHILSGPVALAIPLTALDYDPASQNLLGLDNSVPEQLVRINPETGAETPLFTAHFNHSLNSLTVDASTTTAFTIDLDGGGGGSAVEAVNDVSGTSAAGSQPATALSILAFLDPPPRDVLPGPTAAPGARPTNPEPSPAAAGTRRPLRPMVGRPRLIDGREGSS